MDLLNPTWSSIQAIVSSRFCDIAEHPVIIERITDILPRLKPWEYVRQGFALGIAESIRNCGGEQAAIEAIRSAGYSRDEFDCCDDFDRKVIRKLFDGNDDLISDIN